MASLFKFNNCNKTCLNCQSDKVVIINLKDATIARCLNCTHEEVISFRRDADGSRKN